MCKRYVLPNQGSCLLSLVCSFKIIKFSFSEPLIILLHMALSPAPWGRRPPPTLLTHSAGLRCPFHTRLSLVQHLCLKTEGWSPSDRPAVSDLLLRESQTASRVLRESGGRLPPRWLTWRSASPHTLSSSARCPAHTLTVVQSESSRPPEGQHARLPCPSPAPRVCSNSCPLNQWCHTNCLLM